MTRGVVQRWNQHVTKMDVWASLEILRGAEIPLGSRTPASFRNLNRKTTSFFHEGNSFLKEGGGRTSMSYVAKRNISKSFECVSELSLSDAT